MAAERESKWRVQAQWTVGDDARSYSPVFEDSEPEAQRTAAGMRETLAHFPTLTIEIREVSAEVATAAEARATVPLPTLHAADPGSATTACGLPTEDVKAWAAVELFNVALDRSCPKCVDQLRRTRGG